MAVDMDAVDNLPGFFRIPPLGTIDADIIARLPQGGGFGPNPPVKGNGQVLDDYQDAAPGCPCHRLTS